QRSIHSQPLTNPSLLYRLPLKPPATGFQITSQTTPGLSTQHDLSFPNNPLPFSKTTQSGSPCQEN
ncbi:hypothetical protein, partial [Nitrosomonas marina]|uniref:hypothetical protein n=1 Tax=Nitrosomonas marina TaxID=917 RepID=UPI001C435E35